MNPTKPRVTVVVTCMGRLEFLQQTAPMLLADPRVCYCLVDYSCPQQAGRWLETQYPGLVATGQAMVVRSPGHRYFHKCAALNLGARHAIEADAEYLAFLDADTLVRPGFVDFVLSAVQPRRFLIAGRDQRGHDDLSLVGVLAMPAAQFISSQGFDEAFTHWGHEDIEYRLRLCLIQGLDYGEIPCSLIHGIPHDTSIRFQHSSNRDRDSCLATGWGIISRKLAHDWVGRMQRPLNEAARLYTIERPAPVKPVTRSFKGHARVKRAW